MITKLLKVRKSWIIFFVSLIGAFIMASVSQAAQPTEQTAERYGIKFPITELGNCANLSECRNFCEDPLNSTSCIDYAKTKGFYKEEEVEIKKKTGILEKAKAVLGCDSIESCKNYCQIPTNFEKCDAFAKKQGIAGGQVEDPKKKEIIEKAKEILGCDSQASCAALCSDDANRQKCSKFAKETGLRGGERPVGPGGCTSEATCKAFCSEPANFQICKGFMSSSGDKFQGPGGCNSEESCRSYCTKNPQDCSQSIGGGPVNVPIKYDPQEMCNRTPSCSWTNNTCQCGGFNDSEARKRADEYAKICRENPQRCTPGGIGGSESREDRASFEKYCRENPEKCKPTYSNYNRGVYDPAAECAKYQGCSWTAGSCQCNSNTSTSGSSGYSGGSTGGYGSREDQERGCRSGGGSCDWSYGYCYCRGYQSSGYTTGGATSGSGGSTTTTSGSYSGYNGSTMSREQQESTCKAGGGTCTWNGDTCNCQGYRAPSTNTTTTSGGSTGTTTTSTTTTPTTSTNTTSSTGMSREQQESGCRSCGGTCNWNGDTCQCQCGSSSSSGGSTPAPAQTQEPAQTSAPEPAQTSQPSNPEPAASPTVQGISIVRSIIDRILDLFR